MIKSDTIQPSIFALAAMSVVLLISPVALGNDADAMTSLESAPEATESGGENASNPLAKVKNTDVRWHYLDVGGGRSINDVFIDGAFMATDKLKIKYELHYWETNATGSSQDNLESFLIKAIYFPTEGAWGNIRYRVAAGVDWVVDLGDLSKGIGSGSDKIGPFMGVALGLPTRTMLIPLVQQFNSYSGAKVNTTAVRLIGLQPLPKGMWIKLDATVPFDWESDGVIRGTTELQFGKNINDHFAVYVDGLTGFGGGRMLDWGSGVGLRFKY